MSETLINKRREVLIISAKLIYNTDNTNEILLMVAKLEDYQKALLETIVKNNRTDLLEDIKKVLTAISQAIIGADWVLLNQIIAYDFEKIEEKL